MNLRDDTDLEFDEPRTCSACGRELFGAADEKLCTDCDSKGEEEFA